tara:strand:- start:1112 stop:1681 length:570 start_codon:yes stop_codon:yes gene_type:complete
MNFTKEQKRIAELIGIRNLNSRNDLNRIAAAQQTAKLLGIRNFDSAKDAGQVTSAMETAQRLGIRNIDSAKDIAQIRAAPPAPAPAPEPEPEPEEPFDYERALQTYQSDFERQMAENERGYAEKLGSLEDRLHHMLSRPNTDPLRRSRVMGVRFATGKPIRKKKNVFANRNMDRINDRGMRIKSSAINI